MLNYVLTTVARIGLGINVNKTKVVSFYIQEAGKIPAFINSSSVGEVLDFEYRRLTLIPNNQAKHEIATNDG